MPHPADIEDQLRKLARSADAMERSWSITPTQTERRVLFFFETTGAAINLLGQAARVFRAPEPLLDAWKKALPGCDAIGLALRDDLRSVRLYTQYWEAILALMDSGASTPPLLYAGFKALPDASTRVDSYICEPMVPRRVFMPPITQSLTQMGADADAVAAAFQPLGGEECIFTRTASPARASWLATVRRANLPHAPIAEALAPITQRIPHGAEIARAAANRTMVHIAGGEDTTKGAFTTLYFEAQARDLDGFLTPQ